MKRFIVLEGIDGAGTTTQARMLADWLPQTVCRAAEPTQYRIGRLLRAVMSKVELEMSDRQLALLFAADREDHQKDIRWALDNDCWVVQDRYVGSSLVYQHAVQQLVHQLNEPFLPPDLTIVLNVSADTALRRRHLRGLKPELFETEDQQRRFAQQYRRLHEMLPLHNISYVDAEQSIDSLHQTIVKLVQSRFVLLFN